ncbi:Glycerol-3-phosphate dehydrogenase [NAD(+)], cytoplasmic [Geodia barretti]|uniref:glycerol-3-phosphate dehydrogenase (NAD(+)) n=1 Tax=Geodia barretti TaxID=519541 RepID=A0AA35RI53_GEOBA|nr:Glycerol-3-phosphate dehydrogenase [NAD(+)], cytoplasmic [Geodia barretti]
MQSSVCVCNTQAMVGSEQALFKQSTYNFTNIVAVAAGFVDGLKYGASTKSAVIRIGLQEMWRFISSYYKDCQYTTLLESCGIADLMATCTAGRNRRVCEAFVTTGKPIEELEAEMLQVRSCRAH